MDLRIFTEPQQGATYDDLLPVAQADRGARLRRVLPLRPLPRDGRRRAARARPTPGSRWPGWPARPARSGSARWSPPATFRLPGPLAIEVAQVDQMSGGRVELGLGAGLVRARARGLRHPLPGDRRALRPARGAARDRHRAVGAPRTARRSPTPASTTGSTDSPGAAQAGAAAAARRSSSAASASERTPALAARYADEFNLPFAVRGDHARAVRPGARGLRPARPRPRRADLVQRPHRLRRARRGRVRAPRRGDRPRRRGAARERCRRVAGRGRATDRGVPRRSARSGSTCRPSTSTTSTTSS